jgi:hypothetical protein
LSCDSTLRMNSIASCSGLVSSSLNFTSISWYASCTESKKKNRVESEGVSQRVSE